MTNPTVAQKSPYPIEVKSSQTDDGCACDPLATALTPGLVFYRNPIGRKRMALVLRLQAQPEIAAL
jgi:hypothetical protein